MSASFKDWLRHCERSVFGSLESKKTKQNTNNRAEPEQVSGSVNVQEVRQRFLPAAGNPQPGYLSRGSLSDCLDVIPGKDEKERDDSREWSSDDASAALSMAAKTHLG